LEKTDFKSWKKHWSTKNEIKVNLHVANKDKDKLSICIKISDIKE
jgi:hypothetical protein